MMSSNVRGAATDITDRNLEKRKLKESADEQKRANESKREQKIENEENRGEKR